MRGAKPALQVIEGGMDKVPATPKGMPAEGRAEWIRAASELIDLGILAESDLTSLEMYCTAIAMVRQLRTEAAKCPAVITVKSGAIKKHPVHATLNDYLKTAKQYAAELGLTPAGRNRKAMRDQKPKTDDPWSDMDL